MTQQYKKVRPSRAARARDKKTRTPNIPEFTGPDDWDRTAAPAERPSAPAFGAGASGPRLVTSPFARAARNTSLEITQDYSYLRADLIRLTWTTIVLLVGMLAMALIYR